MVFYPLFILCLLMIWISSAYYSHSRSFLIVCKGKGVAYIDSSHCGFIRGTLGYHDLSNHNIPLGATSLFRYLPDMWLPPIWSFLNGLDDRVTFMRVFVMSLGPPLYYNPSTLNLLNFTGNYPGCVWWRQYCCYHQYHFMFVICIS